MASMKTILVVSGLAGLAAGWIAHRRASGGLGDALPPPHLLQRYGSGFDRGTSISWTGTGIAWGPYFGPNAQARSVSGCDPHSGPVCGSNFTTYPDECALAQSSAQLKAAGAGRYAPHCLAKAPCESLRHIAAMQTMQSMTDGTYELLF
jgi:hypothetical protein